ncbi:ATP-binding protein [Isoptericola jiangsuensis]|uniref:ATP-binding protein n=1 Tax=Isoptericola jiangsuensis TaxID=548579 RepID=UPI003AB07CCB
MAALPMVGGVGAGWEAWVLGSAAVALPVVAAVLLGRASRRDHRVFRSLVLERDRLAAELSEASSSLAATTEALTREQTGRLDERAAVETAVVALSRKVQASAHRVQEEAARMVQRHSSDPDVLQTSMRIDHAAAQHARQAQCLVALCGRRPGQSWDDPLALPDVVHAAAGRITAFHRVEVSGDPGLAVTGRAVEALIHVVAELLANATQCSPPNTQVLVTLRQVQRGAVIEIDDCGVGMDARELLRVRAVASGATTVTVADLGEVPQTGLAVVGTYARFLDLRVDLMESVYGGLRAVVLVPDALMEVAADTPTVLAPSADDAWTTDAGRSATSALDPGGLPAGSSSGLVARDGGARSVGGAAALPATTTGTGTPAVAGPPVLPQRRSRRGEPGTPADAAASGARGSTAPPPAVRAPDQSAEEAGAWIGAFFSAGDDARDLAARAPHDELDPPHDPQHDEPPVEADATSEDR